MILLMEGQLWLSKIVQVQVQILLALCLLFSVMITFSPVSLLVISSEYNKWDLRGSGLRMCTVDKSSDAVDCCWALNGNIDDSDELEVI